MICTSPVSFEGCTNQEVYQTDSFGLSEKGPMYRAHPFITTELSEQDTFIQHFMSESHSGDVGHAVGHSEAMSLVSFAAMPRQPVLSTASIEACGKLPGSRARKAHGLRRDATLEESEASLVGWLVGCIPKKQVCCALVGCHACQPETSHYYNSPFCATSSFDAFLGQMS